MIFSKTSSPDLGIHTLTLQNFRNYSQFTIKPQGHSLILYGHNGAGKTNLLEAVSLLSPGRGLRRARLSDMLKQDAHVNRWSLHAHINSPHGPLDLSTTAHCDSQKERRSCEILGKKEKTLTALSQHTSIVWLTPQMDRLFSEGMSARRRFIDRLCVALFPPHSDLLVTYENLCKERLHALTTAPDPRWLDALEHQLAQAGLKICHRRQEVCFLINSRMAQRQGPFPKALIHTGQVNDDLLALTEDSALTFYQEKLRISRSLDGPQETTTFGPHRFPIDIHHVDKNLAAAYCSTGEQKALLLAIVLAFASTMKEYSQGVPVLLLDEVMAHLDEEKRAHLLSELWALKIQIWMTGTDLSPFLGCEDHAQLFHIEQATLTP